MKWLLLLPPLAVTYYTFTYGRWVLKKGNLRGGVGVFILAAFVLALSLYALYFKEQF